MSAYRLKGTAGSVTNQSWPLENITIIGSDPASAIHVDSEALAAQHAELAVEDDQVSLKLLGEGEGLYLNGIAVEKALLASGDEIRIGNCRWMLQAPGLRPQKVLTDEAVRQRNRWVPWLIVGGLLAAGFLAWGAGLLPF